MLLVLTGTFVGQNQKVYRYLFDNANFTEKHCVNKDNPEKKCNGACQLTDFNENEEPAAPSKPEYRSVDFFLAERFDFTFDTYTVVYEKKHYYQQFDLLKKKDKILVPPPNGLV